MHFCVHSPAQKARLSCQRTKILLARREVWGGVGQRGAGRQKIKKVVEIGQNSGQFLTTFYKFSNLPLQSSVGTPCCGESFWDRPCRQIPLQ